MPEGSVLGFDFGLKRIGLAVGETLLGQARPLAQLREESNEARFKAIDRHVREWQPITLVVGVPCSVEGEAHEMTARCERFARQLEARYKLPVIRIDERFSSTEAEARLAARGQDWQQRKQSLDAEAAAVILQDYFDTHSA